MEQKIITSRSASGLNEKIQQALNEGWELIGGHQVVQTHHQLRYSGMQHKDTQIENEYSQTIKKQ